jgi:putative acetyltransferase
MFLLYFAPVTRPDEDRFLNPGVPAAFQVDQFIANDIAGGKIKAKCITGVKKKLRRRLAGTAGLAGRFRRDIDFVEAHAASGKMFHHPRIDSLHFLHREKSAPHARLIGHDEQFQAGRLKGQEGLRRVREERHFFRVREIFLLLNKRSISIQKDCAAQIQARILANPEMDFNSQTCFPNRFGEFASTLRSPRNSFGLGLRSRRMISVATADPRGAEASRLIAELSAELDCRYPELINNSHLVVDISDFTLPRSGFVVAHLDGQPVGCGALRFLDEDTGEIKRMYVAPAARGQGVGRAILVEIERLAGQFGYRALRLETGVHQPEAIALYTKLGFRPIPCFGKYVNVPISICFEKQIASHPPA